MQLWENAGCDGMEPTALAFYYHAELGTLSLADVWWVFVGLLTS